MIAEVMKIDKILRILHDNSLCQEGPKDVTPEQKDRPKEIMGCRDIESWFSPSKKITTCDETLNFQYDLEIK